MLRRGTYGSKRQPKDIELLGYRTLGFLAHHSFNRLNPESTGFTLQTPGQPFY